MEFKVFESFFGALRFKIVEDLPGVGADIYVYEDDKCVRDDHQDTILMCMEFAQEYFEVPLDSWVRKES
jgi:hypothetical protein